MTDRARQRRCRVAAQTAQLQEHSRLTHLRHLPSLCRHSRWRPPRPRDLIRRDPESGSATTRRWSIAPYPDRHRRRRGEPPGLCTAARRARAASPCPSGECCLTEMGLQRPDGDRYSGAWRDVWYDDGVFLSPYPPLFFSLEMMSYQETLSRKSE